MEATYNVLWAATNNAVINYGNVDFDALAALVRDLQHSGEDVHVFETRVDNRSDDATTTVVWEYKTNDLSAVERFVTAVRGVVGGSGGTVWLEAATE